MKIGLLGLSFNVGNKGCEALSYSCLEILNKIAKNNDDYYEIFLIMHVPLKSLIKNIFNTNKVMLKYYPKKEYSNLKINHIFYKYYNKRYYFINNIKKCDLVIDYTAGDSFTDIYGEERFYKRTKLKEYIINKNIPFILGSQTIGPFNNSKVKKYASDIIEKSYKVFVRDEMSYEYTKSICNVEPILTTDIAFELPYDNKKIGSNNKFKIGINISGLLWSGGYTKDNQFNLKVDYQKYCIELIKELLKNDKNEIHIISHATSTIDGFPDNDLIGAKAIKEMFPQVIITDPFVTAMDAKSYIASMDFFIGARMHATIAALSSKVPVIAFSYSRKFEGLFNSLNYKYVLDTKNDSTDVVLKQTLDWIKSIDKMREDVKKASKLIKEKNKYMKEQMEHTLYSIMTKGDKNEIR